MQVGIPILGVVENMCGLRQAATGFTFKQSNSQGIEVDVTEQILSLIKQQLGDKVILLPFNASVAEYSSLQGQPPIVSLLELAHD